MNISSIINIIENSPRIYEIMKNCPYQILKRWEIRNYPADSVICQQGEVYNSFHLIASGSVNIYYTAENGKRYTQEFQDAGGFFGEFEIFDSKPYICSVEAFTNVTLLQISYPYFIDWLENDKSFNLYIAKHLYADFYQFAAKASEDNLYSLKARLCKLLISLAKKQNCENPEIIFDKKTLSDQFGVAIRSISRILQYLKDEKIIELLPKTIVINNLQRLINESETSWED